MLTLLDKTRALNKLLQKSAGYPVDFKEVALLFGEVIACNVYILDQELYRISGQLSRRI